MAIEWSLSVACHGGPVVGCEAAMAGPVPGGDDHEPGWDDHEPGWDDHVAGAVPDHVAGVPGAGDPGAHQVGGVPDQVAAVQGCDVSEAALWE